MDRKLFCKGMTYGWGSARGEFRRPYAVDSLRKLKETGSEWIALAISTYQDTVFSTDIRFDYGYTVTDRDIAFIVGEAKALGLKVCLKPVVNSRDGIWRARIGFPDDSNGEPYWKKWFRSYTDFICHYAELAEELACEMFCIGCEMVNTEHRTEDWIRLIEEVRKLYKGPLIYNANHGKEENAKWLSHLDLIGLSAYYPVAEGPGATEEEMLEQWDAVKPKLRALYEKVGKPIVFIEIGCRSASGCAVMPWDFEHTDLPFDDEEQARFYSTALAAFWNEPWFSGFFWWDWKAKLHAADRATEDLDFAIHGKKAEQVLREWYRKPAAQG